MQNNKYRILLVNAPVLGVLEPWYDSPDFGRASLAYLAAYLRKFDDFSIEIIDAKLEKLHFSEVLERSLAFRPHIIGFTAFTNEVKPCAYQAALIKKHLPETVTIIGGPHVTAIPEQTLREFWSFDIGVVGDGEITMLELCRAIREARNLGDINGIVYRNEKDIKLTPFRDRILDQDSIPFPAWDLFPKAKTYFVQGIRGCPYQCVFCMNHNGRVARMRSVENVVDEIKWIMEEFSPEWIRFGDELFSVDIERACLLLEELIKIDFGKKVKWDLQTHVRFVNDRFFELLKKANVTTLEMGVETGDEKALKSMGKGTNRKMIIEAFQMAKRHQVKTGALLLFGQPNETLQSLKNTIDLAVAINADLPLLGIMVPFPGTEVAKLAAKGEGGYKLLSTDWDEYNKHPGNALEFTHISRIKLEIFVLWGYIQIFLLNIRPVDMMKFLWTYRGAAFSTIRKMLGRKSAVKDIRVIPGDYASMINAGNEITMDEFISSQQSWKEIQVTEVKRYKQKIMVLHSG